MVDFKKHLARSASAKKALEARDDILIVADCHIGNIGPFGGRTERGLNDRCRMTLAVLEDAIREGKRRGCTLGISAGDLFDSDIPSPPIVEATREVLIASGMDWALMLGNHELRSASPGDHGLASSGWNAPRIWVVDDFDSYDTEHRRELGRWQVAMFPFGTQPPVDHNHHLWVMHAGIADKETPPYLLGPNVQNIDALLASLPKDCFVASGDWHAHKSFAGGRVIQVGALAPKNFSELGHEDYGWAATFGANGLRPFRVPGPRFYSTTGGELDAVLKTIETGNEPLFFRVTVESDEEEAWVSARLAEPRWVGRVGMNYEVLHAEGAPVDMTMSAAKVAASGEVAVERFVATMALPAGVDRAELAAEAKRRL